MLFHLRFFLAVAAAFIATTSVVFAAPPPQAPAPIVVRLRDPLHDARDPAYRIAKKLHLEAGGVVYPTQFMDAKQARTDRNQFLLLATQRVEGGFDAVNLYDRGIVSWGIMQWTAHEGALQDTLWYLKQRLAEKQKSELWAALFKANGLDIQVGPSGRPEFHVGGTNRVTGITRWEPVAGQENLRILFRGTRQAGKFDPPTVTRWGRVFARAGRNPVVQAVQTEWATRRLQDCLGETVDGDWQVSDFTRGDLFSDALAFALWTNNPRAYREHFRQAVRQTRQITAEADPAKWPPALFPFIWEQVGHNSSFGAWGRRTELVAETVGVGGTGRRMAQVALASRGWRVDRLGRSGAVLRAGVRGAGRLWRPAPPVPVAASANAPLFSQDLSPFWQDTLLQSIFPQESDAPAAKRSL